jgi:hypothetical protein
MANSKSFPDPAGFVFESGKRVVRAVNPRSFQTLREFLDSPFAREFILQGDGVGQRGFSDLPGAD